MHQKFAQDEALKQDPKACVLDSLLGFYNRERKPKAWAYYDRLEKSEDELFDDDSVICNVMIRSRQEQDGWIHCRAIYDAGQPIRKDKFATATILEPEVKVKNIQFEETNDHQGELNFQTSTTDLASNIPTSNLMTIFL